MSSQDSDVVAGDNQRMNTSGIKRGGGAGWNLKKRRNNEQPRPLAHAPHKKMTMFSEKARACTECGKEFSSWKALFGHMRCHPEREWRGIHPPQAVREERQGELINNANAFSGPSHIKLHNTQNVHGSRQTIRRNKANLPRLVLTEAQSESESGGSEEEEKEKEEVASYKLVCDDSDTESIEAVYINRSSIESQSQSQSHSQQQVNSFDETKQKQVKVKESTPKEIKEQRDMAHCLVMLASATEDEFDFSDNRNGAATQSTESEVSKFPWHFPVLSSKQLSENVYIEGESGHAGDINHCTFECGTCKKVFRSHQALGGHRASHKKVKGCFARTNDSSSPREEFTISENNSNSERDIVLTIKTTADKLEETNFDYNQYPTATKTKTEDSSKAEDGINLTRKKSKASGGHQCSICFRVFSTGQALGGHKRCHWGAAGDSTSTSTNTINLDQSSAPTLSINTNINITTSHRQIKMPPPPIIPVHNNLPPPMLSIKIKGDFIDLNLPAPMEDEEILEKHTHNKHTTIPYPLELCMGSSNNISLDMESAGELLSLASWTDKTMINKLGQKRGSD